MADANYNEAVRSNSIIGERVHPISSQAAFTILRNTSFSSLISSRTKIREYLERHVFQMNPFCSNLLRQAYHKDYFNQGSRFKLIRLVACMLNAISAKVDCLIVDEAHNYKHGPNGGAIRNQVVARFLGTVADIEIMEAFPELKTKMKYPLADKVICLSATPKDRNLFELKDQISCFTSQNPLLNCETTDDISFCFLSF